MNYPGIKKEYHKYKTFANRGMDLEYLINQANEYYLSSDKAVIYKKPTPIGIKKTNYKNGTIDGFFQSQSTLDYNGVYKGYYLDFDAKETNLRTSFPLANIHAHQLEHIKRVINHKGIAFLIISINTEFYLLDGKILLNFISNNERKSIPYDFIKENAIKIELKASPTLDYLKAVDILIKEEK
ncbi:MAG: Holliday junction resolvase RecU [Bacilli bacterium]|nr:Holliday junction resolvase RecU [Bacilli bacterium]